MGRVLRALIWKSGPRRAMPASSFPAGREREPVMGLGKKAKNKAKVIKGRTKKNAGKATGNKRLQTEGKADVVTGNLKNAGEKVKDAVKR
jgi:uncharacterized protein YjbJ (UPF0337 family)